MTQEERLTQWTTEARELGVEAAITAASWTTDGTGDVEHYKRVLKMLDAGDPRADEHLPERPNLSGEWADSPTPRSLFEDITNLDAHAEATWNMDAYDAVVNALCDAWEVGVGDTFTLECERILRAAVAE